jgi:uncharacterized protein YdhG (YjbR/CyaY superfamily)
MSTAKDVESFLAVLPEGQRAALEQLRATIRDAAPDAVEGIGYGVPSYKYMGRPLVSFGAGKNHCAFYVQSPAVMEAFAGELKGLDTARGTVRFTADKPLPEDLVRRLIQARMDETEAAAAAKRRPGRQARDA